MAGIDKTYTNNFKEYEALKDWASKNKFKCPNGIILDPSDYIYNWWGISDFKKEVPVLNTSNEMDYFLIKYCPLQFVQDRMHQVYPKDYIESILNGTSKFDTFKKENYGTKFKCIERPEKNFRYERALRKVAERNNKYISIYGHWFVSLITPITDTWTDSKGREHHSRMDVWYNDQLNKWLWPYELGYSNTTCCTKFKSLKAVKRQIRKWKLPKGTIVEVNCRYVGLGYKFKII